MDFDTFMTIYVMGVTCLIFGVAAIYSIFFGMYMMDGTPTPLVIRIPITFGLLLCGCVGVYLVSPEFAFSIFHKIISIFYSP